ncbi:hypothetical protein JKF63_04589 [Porcisia hertigi]|uniref:Leucine-rich repeat and coiled-coil domain-containing protein 1 n=1 Tax=Porcisia hertigi TaxID=2761500 RepID=A0A836L8E2_9TRYP|nr:hypothetical protein JKF63_04589 [Porcisia hertigi]
MLSLRFLSVHMNSIKELESGCLRTLRHLVELDLSANELRGIPEGCWEGLGHLERLNLSSNQLTRLGPTAFTFLDSLRWLSLGFNNIKDVSGLRSVPASAPLAYVDLCANCIATLDEVIDALSSHRAHLQELRLESPSAQPFIMTTAEDGGVLPPLAMTSTFLSHTEGGAAAHWLIHENPCCLSSVSATQDASGSTAEDFAAASSPFATTYVERLLSYFPHLLVVNGFSYGVDPLRALRQQRQSQELEVWAEETSVGELRSSVADAPPLALLPHADKSTQSRTLHHLGAPVSSKVGVGAFGDNDNITTPVSDAFARLLRRPLPRLRRSSSSSSGSTSSTSSKGHEKRRRSRDRHRTCSRNRTRSSSQHRRHASSSLSPSPRELPRHRHRAAAAPVAAAAGRQGASGMVPPPERAGLVTEKTRSTQDSSRSPPPSALKSAPLERNERDGQGTVTADTVNSWKGPPPHIGRRTAVAKPRRASLRRRSLSNTTLSATSPLSGTASSPSAVSPSTAYPYPGDQKPQTISSSSRTTTPHARKLRFEAASAATSATAEAPCAPSGIASPGQRGPPGDKSSGLVLLTSPSPAGITDTSDISPPVVAGRGQCECCGSYGKHSEAEEITATTTGGCGGTACVAVKERATLDLPPPLAGAGSVTPLRWRPKQVSRGTCTDYGAEAPLAPSRDAELAARVEQLQEQLALRATTINDLRRHLDLTRTQYVEGQREAQQRQKQLRSQVSALKDELARRGEEVTILQRKQEVQLNRAVESVRAEWVRRLEEAEQLRAETAEEARVAWEERLACAEKEKLHAQQMLMVKAAELATLERQTQAMGMDMRAMRDRAATLQRNWAARTGLLLAEAEERCSLESTAAASRAQLCRSFYGASQRIHMEALREADRCRERAEEALREQQVTWKAHVAAYEDAMRHAASEVRHVVTGRHSDHIDSRQVTSAQEDIKAKNGTRGCAPLSVERSAVDDSALVSTATAVSLNDTQGDDSGHDAAAVCVAASDALMPIPGETAEGVVAEYWKSACVRVEAQLHRVETALHVATLTQQSMAAENTRLLSQVEALETEKKEALAALQSSSGVAAQERDNLLRTLHTLRADMGKKDAALDVLEEEAHAKLNEKRHRIAELEGAVEALSTQQARATEVNASMREQLEAAQAAVERLQQELADAKERCKTVVHLQAEQVPDLERKQRELSELLATRNAEAHQHQLEKRTLVHTLTTAREQLVRLHDSHKHLLGVHASAKEQITRLQAELDTARRQVSDLQEVTRAKKKATLEVLSHLMASDAL